LSRVLCIQPNFVRIDSAMNVQKGLRSWLHKLRNVLYYIVVSPK